MGTASALLKEGEVKSNTGRGVVVVTSRPFRTCMIVVGLSVAGTKLFFNGPTVACSFFSFLIA